MLLSPTQKQHSHLSQSKAPAIGGEGGSDCRGAQQLMKLLGNYSRNLDLKTAIRVGVVGYPNVGKSSVINSLKRDKACGVGAVPGFTRTVQEVQLSKNIMLLDSPGIVFAMPDNSDDLVLRNCVRVDSLVDPIQVSCSALLCVVLSSFLRLCPVPVCKTHPMVERLVPG